VTTYSIYDLFEPLAKAVLELHQLNVALLDLAQLIFPLGSQDWISNLRSHLLNQADQCDSFLGRQQLLFSGGDVVASEKPLDNG